MKKLTTLTLITLLSSITFISCGGGTCPNTQVLAIDASCNVANDMTDYIQLQKGDIISKQEDNTTINIFHDQENQKVACGEWECEYYSRGVD